MFILICSVSLFGSGCAKSKSVNQLQIKTIDARIAPLVVGKQSRIYHARDCPYATSLESPVGYASVLDVERAGRIPCEFCAPHLYESPSENTAPKKNTRSSAEKD
ncbi:MAG: hypothetical protein V1899_12135 [Planctomycetota bacterium]